MNAIFAVNARNGFSHGNDLPWPRSTSDLSRFREITTGKTVVMGRGTWESNMPKPLPNRRNIVLSKTLHDSKCEIFSNLTELSMNIGEREEVFVIGGAQLLWSLRLYVNQVYLTRFRADQESTIIFDTQKYLENFELVSSTDFGDHTFEIYRRT
jgi:dihydrofolate reductase